MNCLPFQACLTWTVGVKSFFKLRKLRIAAILSYPRKVLDMHFTWSRLKFEEAHYRILMLKYNAHNVDDNESICLET